MESSRPAKQIPALAPEKVLDAVAFGVIAVDRNGCITSFNRAAAQISGLEPHEALGRPCREVFKSSLCEGDCPLRGALESGEGQFGRDAVFIRHQGRSVVPVKVSVTPLRGGNGQVVGAVETVQSHQLAQLLAEQKGVRWEDYIGESPQVQRIFEVLRVVAPQPVTVMIEGPTGTGKDLLARIIHEQSPRAKKPFIKVNCAALPETLLESEMFGYARGAFTGAERDKPGRFNLADSGTIFLDEVSELPLTLQAKLLRVIEEREFFPLGARKTTRVDVRILIASNKHLHDQVQRGLFREDLYYRLNVIRVYLPPLRERRQDIPLLVRHFIQKKNVERGNYICRFEPSALDRLLNYSYPGNVRELENILEHACLLCQGDVVGLEHLPWALREESPPAPGGPEADAMRQRILDTLARENWNRTRAARALSIDRTTLWRRMKRYGITPP